MSFIKKKFTLITIVYWVLLLYMVSALLWWFIALNNQNYAMASMRIADINKDDPAYLQKLAIIESAKQRKTTQYIGEGTTFFVLMVIGAVFVYRAALKQIKLSVQQQNFMMAITHELKTPIAITQLNLETLQKRKLEEIQQNKLIQNTIQEANRLNALCNNILLAAQIDGGRLQANYQEINFSELLQTCVQDFTIRYPQRKFSLKIQNNIFILGEELLLQMLVNNLIDNALKYSPKDTAINIALNEANHQIQFGVADSGIGISDDEKKKVFDKFYRTGDENTRMTKGTGLGLYLSKKIVETHKGYISVTDNLPQGTIFTASFTPTHG
jgi:two-component system sensor histidine kinase CiaH